MITGRINHAGMFHKYNTIQYIVINALVLFVVISLSEITWKRALSAALGLVSIIKMQV